MKIFIWQSIGIVISLFYIANTSRRFFEKEARLSLFKFSATLIVWGTILYFSVFPRFPLDLTFITFVIVFMFIFRLLHIIEKLEKNITEIVRQEALKKIKK